MASRKLPPIAPSAPSSWMDLLAAATLHDTKAGTIQAEIVAETSLVEPLRLVVQSYEKSGERPIGSVQRAVSATELRQGVHVRLLELRQLESSGVSRVVAWVEPGLPDLELDARSARPSDRALVGEATGSDVRIVLRRGFRRAA